jgi:hypothetical protein
MLIGIVLKGPLIKDRNELIPIIMLECNVAIVQKILINANTKVRVDEL